MTSPAELVALMPFAATLEIELTRATPEEVVGRMPYAAGRTTAGGIVHGGALMALADSVGAACAVLNLPDGATTATTNSATVFLRGVRAGDVTATARPLHIGRSTIAVRTDLHDEQGRLVAQVTQSQAVLPAR